MKCSEGLSVEGGAELAGRRRGGCELKVTVCVVLSEARRLIANTLLI